MSGAATNPDFGGMVEGLEPRYRELLAAEPMTCGHLPADLPAAGVYLLSEHGEPLYVGRADNLRARLRGHHSARASRHAAQLALRLARESTRLIRRDGAGEDASGEELLDPVFESVFAASRLRVAAMEVRVVAEEDPRLRELLETYVVTALRPRYNAPQPA